MIPNCVDPVTNPIVQDMLRRRDETIECLIEEIKEIEKLKEHYKTKYEGFIESDRITKRKIFMGGLTAGGLMFYLIIIIALCLI